MTRAVLALVLVCMALVGMVYATADILAACVHRRQHDSEPGVGGYVRRHNVRQLRRVRRLRRRS